MVQNDINQSINQSISQSINQSISQSTNQSINQSANQSINHSDLYGNNGPSIEQWTRLNVYGDAWHWILGARPNRLLWSRRYSTWLIKLKFPFAPGFSPIIRTMDGAISISVFPPVSVESALSFREIPPAFRRIFGGNPRRTAALRDTTAQRKWTNDFAAIPFFGASSLKILYFDARKSSSPLPSASVAVPNHAAVHGPCWWSQIDFSGRSLVPDWPSH